MRKWCGVALVGLVVAVAFAGSSRAQEAGSDAPYLYYYSDYYDGIVVERADGTDRRVIGERTLPDENISSSYKPSWSPSGKWIAATTGRRSVGENPYNFDYAPWAVSIDGQRLHVGIDEILDGEFAWSPAEDLLFVVGYTVGRTEAQETNRDELKVQFALINPDTNVLIASRQYSASYASYGWPINPAFLWTPDGEYVLTVNSRDVEASWYPPVTFLIFHKSGMIMEKTIDAEIIGDLSVQGDVIYETLDRHSIAVENVITENYQEFRLPYGHSLIEAEWHPWGEYALIETQDTLWLLEPTARRLQKIHEAPQVSYLWASSSDNKHWSENGEFALFRIDGVNYQFDPRAMILSPAPDPLEWVSSYPYLDCEAGCERSTDGRYAATIGEFPMIYDLVSGTAKPIRPHNRRSPSAGAYGKILWHPQQNWLITAEADFDVDSGGGTPFKGVTDAEGTVRRDFEVLFVDWLPAAVDHSEIAYPESPLPPTPKQVIHGSNRWSVLSWKPDGHQLAGSSWGDGSYAYIIWDVVTTQEVATLENPDHKALEWEQSANGDFEAILTVTQPYPELWTGDTILATSPDGSQLIIPGQGAVLDAVTGETIALLPLEFYAGWGSLVDYSSDGKLLAISGPHNSVAIWDTQTWQPIVTLDTYAMAVAFSPDGTKLAVGSSWDIQIWDVAEVLAWGREE